MLGVGAGKPLCSVSTLAQCAGGEQLVRLSLELSSLSLPLPPFLL